MGVFIGAGSRNETLETSGAAHFLEHLHFKGTRNRSRVKLEREVENGDWVVNGNTKEIDHSHHFDRAQGDQRMIHLGGMHSRHGVRSQKGRGCRGVKSEHA